MPMILRVGQWPVARRILATGPARVKAALHMATLQEAHYFRKKVVEGFREQAPGGKQFTPLAPSTLAVRKFKGFRGTKALIVRGDLRNSISVHSPGPGVAFIGVLRSARGRGGQSLVNVAEVHEFGSRPFTVRITPKMRAFLQMALGKAEKGQVGRDERGRFTKAKGIRFSGSGTGVVTIRIPARPFMRPVAEKYFRPSEVKMRFLARIGRLLGGDFGQMGIPIPR